MNGNLSIYRLWLLMRADFLAEWRAYAFIGGFSGTMYLLITLSDRYFGTLDPAPYQSLFAYALFIWGLVATKRAFSALHSPDARESYLLLPASALEKILARLLPLTAGFAIALPVYMLVASAIIEAVHLAAFGSRRPIFDLFDPDVWEALAIYCVIQSPFFLGAVWFRRFAIIKTLFVLTLVLTGLIALIVCAGYLAARNFDWIHSAWRFDHPYFPELHGYDALDRMLAELDSSVGDAVAVALWSALALMPPALWCIAWLRLSETQAEDGI